MLPLKRPAVIASVQSVGGPVPGESLKLFHHGRSTIATQAQKTQTPTGEGGRCVVHRASSFSPRVQALLGYQLRVLRLQPAGTFRSTSAALHSSVAMVGMAAESHHRLPRRSSPEVRTMFHRSDFVWED